MTLAAKCLAEEGDQFQKLWGKKEVALGCSEAYLTVFALRKGHYYETEASTPNPLFLLSVRELGKAIKANGYLKTSFPAAYIIIKLNPS